MAKLGVPYRLMYEAKNLTSGLQDVTAEVHSPNGAALGTLSLTEETGAPGIYTADFVTPSNGDEGEYLVIYSSPSENIKAFSRISYVRPTGAVIQGNENFSQITGVVRAQKIIKGVIKQSKILGAVQNNSVVASIKEQKEIKGNINSNSIVGAIR